MSSYRPVVAIAGLNGALGQATLDALLSTQFMASFQLPIRVLMRTPLNFQGPMYPAGMVRIALIYFGVIFGSRLMWGNHSFNSIQAVYLGVDYGDPDVLDDALENVDVVINLLGSMFCFIHSLVSSLQ